jgi:hypothetical protein
MKKRVRTVTWQSNDYFQVAAIFASAHLVQHSLSDIISKK